jgi:hypothetical protein
MDGIKESPVAAGLKERDIGFGRGRYPKKNAAPKSKFQSGPAPIVLQ